MTIRSARRKKAEMDAWRVKLVEITSELKPATVRQVFYQATVRHLCEKTEQAYKRVAHTLAELRKDGVMPYDWLADATRWQRKPRCFDSLADAVESTARFYRRDAMTRSDRYVEIWLEKEALAGVVVQATEEFDTPLMCARGFASLSFLYSAAEAIKYEPRPTTVYHLGDFDPSGQKAARSIRNTLLELSGREDMDFVQLAVLPEQIEKWNLPSRPTKREGNTHARGWKGDSVEFDAIHPHMLRNLVRGVLHRHIPQGELTALRAAEASERRAFEMFRQELGEHSNPTRVLETLAVWMGEVL